MNKLFKSIVAASVGVAMAIGVGAGLGREANAVYATDSTLASTTGKTYESTITYNGDEYDGFKIGTNSATGTIQFSVATGATSCSFYAAGWNGKQVKLSISSTVGTITPGTKSITAHSGVSGSGNAFAIDGTDADYLHSFSLSSITSDAIIKITTASDSGDKRAVIWNASYEIGGNTPDVILSSNSAKLAIGGPSVTITAEPNEYVASNATYNWSNTSGEDCVILTNENTPSVTIAPKGDVSASCTLTLSVTGCNSKTVSVSVTKPLTVAEARTAINGAGSSSIPDSYVKGIISQIDSYSSDYHSITYWISDDGTTTDQLEVYSGKGLNGADFSATTDIERGATVIICGSLKKFNSTYEFDKNNYQISYTAPATVPATDITLDKTEMNVEVGFGRQLTAELNAGAHDPISWYSEDESIATVVDGFVTGVSTDDVTITAFIDTNENGEPDNGEISDECNVSVVDVLEYGDENNPLSIDDAKAVLDVYGSDETRLPVYITGVVSENGAYTTNNNPNYYNNGVWLQNGDVAKAFELFKAVTSSSYLSQYSDADSLAGKEVVAYGYGKIYGGTYELATSSRTPSNPTIIEVLEPAKVLSSIAVSGQTTSFNVGDDFVFGGIVTATYSDNSTADVTSSASFTGYNMTSAGEQTVTVTYEEKTATYKITVSEPQPADPYIEALFGSENNSAKTSSYENTWYSTTNGFVVDIVNANNNNNGWDGQIGIGRKNNDSIASITTREAIVYKVKKITINFTSATLPSNMTSIIVEKSEDKQTWNEIGTMTYSAGSQTVSIDTPTANLYYRIVFTCTSASSNGFCKLDSIKYVYDASSVPVETPEEQIEALNSFAKLSYNYEKTGAGFIQSLNNANTINNLDDTYADWTCSGSQNINYDGNSGGKYNSIQLRASTSNQAKSGIIAKNGNSEILAKKVTLKWNGNNSSGRTVEVYGSNTAYEDVSDLYDDNKGTKIGEIIYDGGYVVKSLTISDNYQYIGIKSKSGTAYLDAIDIQWGAISYEYDDVAIRLGGAVDKDLWDELNGTTNNIEGYGVLLSNKDYLGNTELKTLYGSANSDNFKTFDMALSTKAPVDGGDYYYWNLYKRVTDYLTEDYVAVAYIRTKTGVVFFQEVTASAKSLANDLINDKTCDLDSFEGSLANLACQVKVED